MNSMPANGFDVERHDEVLRRPAAVADPGVEPVVLAVLGALVGGAAVVAMRTQRSGESQNRPQLRAWPGRRAARDPARARRSANP